MTIATKPVPASFRVVVPALAVALMLAQVALMAAPAVMVDLAALWSLDGVSIGWLGGIYFAGYALVLPFLTGAAGRMDGRIVYAVSALVAAVASFAFAGGAEGFRSALALRFVAGAGFAGVHIVGLKLMADRLAGSHLARGGSFYSAAYAVGSGLSFLIAGAIAKLAGWQAAFLAAGAASLAAIPLVLLIGAPAAGVETRSTRWLPDFRAVLRNTAAIRYVVAYAGNTWEVFAMRVWFVPLLAFTAGRHGGSDALASPSALAGISAIAAVPVSLIVAELGLRHGRERTVKLVSLASVVASVALGFAAAGPYALMVALLFLHGATSYGDAGAINGGVVVAATPETRNATLALFGMAGFVSGFVGSFAVGYAIDVAGGPRQPMAWLAGCAVVGSGSVLTALAMSSLGLEASRRLARRAG